MTDRLLTIGDGPAPPPGLYDLRLLERRLDDRIAELDASVDVLLHGGDPADERAVAAIDVLCAAIAEAQELRTEARREAAIQAVVRRARRERPRRWA